MDIVGTTLTVRPIDATTADNPRAVDLTEANGLYDDTLVKRLRDRGFDARLLGDGVASGGFAVTSKLVRVDPGSTGARVVMNVWMQMLFRQNAVYEVEGFVGQADAPLVAFSVTGKGYNSTRRRVVDFAAKAAAMLAARQIAKALAAR